MCLNSNGHGNRRARNILRSIAMGALSTLVAVSSFPAMAQQGKDLSDKSVTTLMEYAWTITPARFTLPSGKEIVVDKANKQSAIVPIENAREIIKVGRLSANAQICGLREEEGANYQTLMARETAKKKWTDQQLLYISQLHLLTVMMLTGRVSVVATENEDKKVVVEDHTKEPEPKPINCSDAERQKVGEQIMTYVKSEPAAEAKK